MKEKEDNLFPEMESEQEKPRAIPAKAKDKYKVIGIAPNRIYLSYFSNGIECGRHIPFEEKYKNLKLNEEIYL